MENVHCAPLASALDSLGARTATISTLGAGLSGQVKAGERTTPDAINASSARRISRRRRYAAMEVFRGARAGPRQRVDSRSPCSRTDPRSSTITADGKLRRGQAKLSPAGAAPQ
jgi:hypothetical protein